MPTQSHAVLTLIAVASSSSHTPRRTTIKPPPLLVAEREGLALQAVYTLRLRGLGRFELLEQRAVQQMPQPAGEGPHRRKGDFELREGGHGKTILSRGNEVAQPRLPSRSAPLCGCFNPLSRQPGCATGEQR